MEILIIGTEPPCVRCQRTFKLANEVAQQLGAGIKVKKAILDSEEAKKYGKVTDFHWLERVAKVKVTDDREKLHRLAHQDWTKELDDALRPAKEKAEEMGYLLTPVLVINGQVKSTGFVPDEEQIRDWIESELKH
jgi:protein-disulfide isomerase